MSDPRPSSVCRELRTRGFRNLGGLDLVFPPEGAAIAGPNGAGKSNLLEALYYLEIFRSFRGASDAQLVTFGEPGFHLRGRFARSSVTAAEGESVDASDGQPREVTAAYRREGRKKRVQVNGVPAERLGDAIGTIGMVLFSPGDVEIIAGSPSERRRFLDITLSLNVPGYLDALQEYRRVHRQRNALLREGAAPAMVAAWDDGLVSAGTRMMRARAAWLTAYAHSFAAAFAAIGGSGGGARMRYAPSVPLESLMDENYDNAEPRRENSLARMDPAGHGRDSMASDIAAAFRDELRRTAELDRERGFTQTGPHRDDVRFNAVLSGREVDLRRYGSAGQQRTAAIALRLIEAETVRREQGRDPVILLDDVFAELDPGRSERLWQRLESYEPGQVLLTAAKESEIEFRHGALPHWRIHDGRVST